MAAQANSPPTSISSHTLSFSSTSIMTGSSAPATQNPLFNTLTTSAHAFLLPTQPLHAATLALVKNYLDPLAADVSTVQAEKLREIRGKRKRTDGNDEGAKKQRLLVQKLYTDGFGVQQVWEQARRVVEAAANEAEGLLEEVGTDELVKDCCAFIEDEAYTSASEQEDPESTSGSELDDGDLSAEEGDFSEGFDVEEEMDSEHDEEHDDVGLMDEDDKNEDEAAEEFVADPHGLNDGFFSIDEFNKQSEFLEHQDQRGDPNDGAASDEEDVDWEADPLAMDKKTISSKGNGKRKQEDEDMGDDESEDGPTFGDMDLHASEGASDEEDTEDDADDMDDLSNANNVMYTDFFAPPARKRKGKRGRPNPHNFPAKDPEAAEPDILQTISGVHRDLFSESEPEDDSAADLSDLDPSDPKSRRSNNERRQAKLLAEIRALEAGNVAKRSWTLQGEARAAERPVNSLLEEDLEFERAGKPVPVITAEVTEDIEALIKRRILAREFDEVIRRRPDELLNGATGRRGRLEDVSDVKSKKSLGELYEEDHLRQTDPNFVEVRDEKLEAEHREIEGLWRDISGRLDSLSSWHYRPKPVEMHVQVRTDASVVQMEDARPNGAGGEVAVVSQLAPQEVYKVGQEKAKDEIVTKGGEVVKREELTREQKLRRRRREKERTKKASSGEKAKESEKSKEKKEVVKTLKKGGVTVIGNKGELKDVEGKAVKGESKRVGGGAFKL
ncbi:Mpp10 protein [Trichodelitschia bisporula]|uniref:U3 small nucleolar ribonucleoprotein protein MPP10 n=1 Tax=Trichodelitschia bisporula TaxID=703511 RepID=A0A6G1HT93_9PEZI|nr:Mpp10 protein [Trichodelitschia bisporula]